MRASQIKTIDVNCKEWFDKVNGNSYFAGEIIINAGKKNETTIKIPFQYGYDEHYKDQAFKILIKEIKGFKDVGIGLRYWRQYEDHKIKATHSIKRNCLKRELLQY